MQTPLTPKSDDERPLTPSTAPSCLVQVAGDGFIPGEAVAVAVVYRHVSASFDGTLNACVEMGHSAKSAEVVLLGRISNRAVLAQPAP